MHVSKDQAPGVNASMAAYKENGPPILREAGRSYSIDGVETAVKSCGAVTAYPCLIYGQGGLNTAAQVSASL